MQLICTYPDSDLLEIAIYNLQNKKRIGPMHFKNKVNNKGNHGFPNSEQH